jgi:periplasmic copper chaperone A
MPYTRKSSSLLAVAALAVGTAAASAHVTVQPSEAVAGSYFQMAFVVPHGCDGKATVAVRVKVPDGVTAVKPQMKPGWTVEIKTRKLDAPQPATHGKSISETVDEVSWRGGPLPDNLYDTFGLMMKLPDTADSNLYFPVVQECDEGVHRWIEIPAAGQSRDDLREPAPLVRLKPKSP